MLAEIKILEEKLKKDYSNLSFAQIFYLPPGGMRIAAVQT